MAFLIGGANSAADTGYDIDNSCRFDDGDSAALTREFSGDPDGNRKTFTISFWVKRSTLTTAQAAISAATTSSFYDQIIFASDDGFEVNNVASASDAIQFKTSAKLRDVSAWYHIVVAMDTTQASASNGIKIYINGVLQTSFATSTYTQNATFEIGRDGSTTSIGRAQRDSDKYFDGYLSEFYFIDGTQEAQTAFGEFDEDSGIWKPKAYAGSYGANGFFLEFKNSAVGTGASDTIGADTSGQDEHFTSVNLAVTDQTTDTPTNNFATLNAASNLQSGTLSEGDCKLVTSSSANSLVPLTIGVQNGKWYVEVKAGSTNYPAAGILNDAKVTESDQYLGKSGSLSRFIRYDGQKSSSNSNSTYMASWKGGSDILQIALDMDNGKITFGKNGQWGDGSGNSDETFANSTAAFTDINSSGDYTGHFAMLTFGDENSGTSDTLEVNFGNPSFSISSGNADANGYGNFEYAVPSGYYALCTKNLAEYG